MMGDRLTVVRSLSLTQKGMTATCDVCAGVGAVLAASVYDGNQETTISADGSEPRRVYVNELAAVLIPCPGCFTPSRRTHV